MLNKVAVDGPDAALRTEILIALALGISLTRANGTLPELSRASRARARRAGPGRRRARLSLAPRSSLTYRDPETRPARRRRLCMTRPPARRGSSHRPRRARAAQCRRCMGTHTPPRLPARDDRAPRGDKERSSLGVGCRHRPRSRRRALAQPEEALADVRQLADAPDVVVVQRDTIYGLRRVLRTANPLGDRPGRRGSPARLAGDPASAASRARSASASAQRRATTRAPSSSVVPRARGRDLAGGADRPDRAVPAPHRQPEGARDGDTRPRRAAGGGPRAGVEFVDCAPALLASGERTTGANGYNLNAAGSRIVARDASARSLAST